MLASDSDSEFEYPNPKGGNSDASIDDECGLLGKIALGIDPKDMKAYDGRSTPQNGSQFLLKVMAEKKSIPKVVYADVSKLVKVKTEEEDGVRSNYLANYLQRGNALGVKKEDDCVDANLIPSTKWREETVSNFSATRIKIERWYHKIESRQILVRCPFDVPESNDNVIWLKFCFGQPFLKLAAAMKTKSNEERLLNFFIDIYDNASISELYLEDKEDKPSLDTNNACDEEDCSSSVKSSDQLILNGSSSTSKTNEDKVSETSSTISLGHSPLMNLVMQLSQGHLESLIKWNVLWLRNVGFINQCQGQWLYAVLACIAKPVDPSVMSDIRTIARLLIKIRNSIQRLNTIESQTNQDDEHCENSVVENSTYNLDINTEKLCHFINTLNLFIYIIADYFYQKDLIMHV